jgi:AcrR family transcriptional regulator
MKRTGESSLASPANTDAPTIFSPTRRRRRDALYEAAVALFVERGYDGTTMDDIATASGAARATVFNHFPRKIEFLDEWGVRRRQRAAESLERGPAPSGGLRDVLSRYMTELALLSEQTRAETVALMAASVRVRTIAERPALASALEEFVVTAQGAGEVPRSVDPRLAGLVLATSYFVVMADWIHGEPPPFDLRAKLLEVVSLVLDGMLTR